MTDDTDTIFTYDAATVSFDSVETDGIVVDEEDGTTEFDWSEIPVVRLDEPPHARAFDTDEFYKIEGATTARPIRQPYAVGDDVEVYVKPADELRDAAWSLENRPYVLGHPDTGMVKDTRDVHGFWRNPRYNDDEDRLQEDLYIPKGDEEAMDFVANNTDVSLGFYNRLYTEYDGDIGGLVDPEEDHVDAYQADIFVDHIAGVENGRCSSEHGCGLDGAHGHGSVVGDATTSFLTKEGQTKKKDGDKNSDKDEYVIAPTVDDQTEITHDYTRDGRYFAVAPDENADNEPKYPINNCSDVEDAWGLRTQGDIDISVSTLEDRIRAKARDLDCDVPGTDDNEDSDMADTDTTDDSDDGGFDLPDLSIDALAAKHDDVRELREAKNELETDMEGVKDALGLDECPCEADLDSYAEAKSVVEKIRDVFAELDSFDSEDESVDLVDFAEDMAEEYAQSREAEREEALDRLEELKADRDEWADEGIEAMRDEIERREQIVEEVDASAPSTDESATESKVETVASRSGREVIPRGAR